MVIFPNAKINLGLNVLKKRTDGYHDLESVLVPIALHDILEIVPSGDGEETLETTGLKVPCLPEENLCLGVFHLLAKDFNIPAVRIHLHKVVPMGAGLGGGSSDGAGTIKILNEIYSLGLPASQMKDYARETGSDCAFFIDNETAFATGKGELLEPIDVNLTGHRILIVIPPIHISTAEAYRSVIPAKPAMRIPSILKMPIEDWKDVLCNDFETSVFQFHPDIRKIKEQLYSAGAVYASMSGSGAAVYGIFRDEFPVTTLFSGCITWEGKL